MESRLVLSRQLSQPSRDGSHARIFHQKNSQKSQCEGYLLHGTYSRRNDASE